MSYLKVIYAFVKILDFTSFCYQALHLTLLKSWSKFKFVQNFQVPSSRQAIGEKEKVDFARNLISNLDFPLGISTSKNFFNMKKQKQIWYSLTDWSISLTLPAPSSQNKFG